MDILAEIQQRLQKYPDVRLEVGKDSISVLPITDTGFTVSMIAKSGYSVYFNGWHEEFTDETEALNCFACGLSGDCRLQKWRRGGAAYKWTAQYLNGDNWVDDSTTGLVTLAFWKPAVAVLLQNHLVPAADAGDV